MPDPSLLSDDLVRQLVEVGQVDLLVAVPTLNNAGTVADVVRAVQAGCATHLPRARMVLLNSDGGSTDGTPALVQQIATDDGSTVTASHRLRTAHRITTPYQGPRGKASALQLIFASADLLQASAVAVVDPEVTSVTPEWVPALVRPILRDNVDLVAPVYARHPLDAPLATQFVRPLVGAVLGRRMREPLAGEFGCSGRFATAIVEQPIWNSSLVQQDSYIWAMTAALAADLRVAQTCLGPRTVDPRRPVLPLSELFPQAVGSVFACLEAHAPVWLKRDGVEPVPVVGHQDCLPTPPALPDLSRMSESFSTNVHDLHPVLAEILPADVLSGIVTAAGGPENPAEYGDDLWAATLYGFLVAHQRAVMRREHIVSALLPLYLGRTVAFLLRYGAAEPEAIEDGHEQLFSAFERARPELVARWPPNS